MERWYNHWLKKASKMERGGAPNQAVSCLDKAEKYTGDPDELKHLDIWRNRLKKLAAAQDK